MLSARLVFVLIFASKVNASAERQNGHTGNIEGNTGWASGESQGDKEREEARN